MKIAKLLLTTCLTASLISLPFTSGVASAAEKRAVTAQDLWGFKRIGGPVLSPDGRSVVFTVQEWSIEKNKAISNLWLADVASGKVRRLTRADASDTTPAWSPDGSRIAFASKRGDDQANALYVIQLDGGEAEEIIKLPYAITTPKWLPDNKHVVMATLVIPELAGRLTEADLAKMRKEVKRRRDSKMTARVTERQLYRFWDQWLTDNLAHRLVLANVETRELRDLTPNWDRLFSVGGTGPEAVFELSPDGNQLAVAVNTTPLSSKEKPNLDIYLVPTNGSGEMKNLTSDNPSTDGQPRFAWDGKSIVFYRQIRSLLNSGENKQVWRHDLGTGKNAPMTRGLDYSFDDYSFSRDGRSLWLLAEERGVLPVFKLNIDSGGFAKIYGDGTSTSLGVGQSMVVFLNESFNRPAELFVLDPATGRARQLTHLNDDLLAQLDLGKVESHIFMGAKNRQIQLWLTYPPRHEPNRKYPLVQLLHGGPHTMARDAFSYRWNAHVFASSGYFVAQVNRHGSTGFGEEFASSILGEWGEKPFTDIMRATDYLLEKVPSIDREHVAAAGASYGGYLAAWTLGHTDRFKCIVDHAGVNSFYGQYAGDITGHFFTDEVTGGTPWKNVAGMQRNNPMFYAENFKTPTLIIQGELDYRVPYGSALELYGVLQAMGVPSRLVVYPNENHWILSPQNSIYWNYEVQQWLSRFLGGKPMEKPKFEAEDRAE
jgi:dipeptidyl aminopeptidase/acylaminoacyl peptidase